jgi:hypothetical protein
MKSTSSYLVMWIATLFGAYWSGYCQKSLTPASKIEAAVITSHETKDFAGIIELLSQTLESKSDLSVRYFLVEARLLYSQQIVEKIKDSQPVPPGTSLYSVLTAAREDSRLIFRKDPRFVPKAEASFFKMPIRVLRTWIEEDLLELKNVDDINGMCKALSKRWGERFNLVALQEDERAAAKNRK